MVNKLFKGAGAVAASAGILFLLTAGSAAAVTDCANTTLNTLGVGSQYFPHYCTGNDLIFYIIGIIMGIIGILSVLFLIIGGYRYITSAGNAEQAKKGTKTIMYAVLGLLVAIISFMIITIVSRTALQGAGSSEIPLAAIVGTGTR